MHSAKYLMLTSLSKAAESVNINLATGVSFL